MEKTGTKPTASQVETLMSDWLGNLRQKAEGNYTHKGKGGIHTDKRYSDYIFGNVDRLSPLELLKKGREAARNVVVSVTNKPFDIVVGGTNSYNEHNGKSHLIHLGTDYFDDETLSKREKVDILLGLAAHEGAHSAYTDLEENEKHLTGKPDETNRLKHQIWNVLEDERIEYLLGDEKPGLAGCIGATKRYYFKKLVSQMKTNGQLPTEPIPRLIAALTQAIRYPSEMERQDIIDNFDKLDAIRKVLTPYPLTSESCWNATERIMDIISETMKEQMQQEQQQQQQQGQGQQDPGNGGQPGQTPDAPSAGNGKAQNKKKDKGQNQDGKGEPTPAEVAKALEKALQTEQGKRVMDAMSKDIAKNDSSATNDSRELSSSEGARFVNEDDAECVSAGSGNPSMFIFKPKGDSNIYAHIVSTVRSSIPAMSHALTCKSQEHEYVLRGMPGGKLNTNKLTAFRMGCKTIFTKSGLVTCSSASVCLLIDESGSMSGTKQYKAREAAVLVNEAIARIPNVRFFCYGYTDDRLNVYSEMNKTSKWSLSATEARGGTPTGQAMEMAAERLRRYGDEPCLMLVMTDGRPDSNSKVVETDSKLRKKGFIPIGIGILSSAVSNSFKEYVVLNDITSLPLLLGKMTRKHLDRMLIRSEQ